MTGYTDASFAAYPDNRKSTSGMPFFLIGGPRSFGVKSQTMTAQSTAEESLLSTGFGQNEPTYLPLQPHDGAGIQVF